MSLGLSLNGRINAGYYDNYYEDNVINKLADNLMKELSPLGYSRRQLISDRISFQQIISDREELFSMFGKKSEVLSYTYSMMKCNHGLWKEYTLEEKEEFIKWYEAL